MSKLFEKLKGAAREREGGLLLDALATKKGAPNVVPEKSGTQFAAAQSPPSSHTPLAGIAVALAIFGLVMVAWHSAPSRAPPKVKIDTGNLKVERTLDAKRINAPRPADAGDKRSAPR